MPMRRILCFSVIAMSALLALPLFGADDSKPAYTLKPLEFPPLNSEKRVAGELVTLDFYHRKGQFRTATGELIDFSMPAYGAAFFLNYEADLRDLPLGLRCVFYMFNDEHGKLSRAVAVKDQYTLDASEGIAYRLDEAKVAEGKLLVTRQRTSKTPPEDLGKQELVVSDQTKVWKGGKQAQLSDLAAGDLLLFNSRIENGGKPGLCTDIYAGAEAQKQASEAQKKKFIDFWKFRGIPAWIEKTEGLKMTAVLFSGDAQVFKTTWAKDFGANYDISVVVANDEIRTWNPPVDREYAKINEQFPLPTENYGCSGIRIIATVKHMLEGFRRGHYVRLFGGAWPVKDMPFGEGIYTEMQTAEINVLTPKEFPAQFPWRTDVGNENLPWYQVKVGEIPPRYSEHLVFGELVKVDAEKGAGQFRIERTGETVDFTMIAQGAMVAVNTNKIDDGGPVRWIDAPAQAMVFNALAGLNELPLGSRCRFNMFQDEKGAFTKANLITDEFTYLAMNKIVYRVESLLLAENKLRVARQIPQRKDYNGDMVQPNDIGRAELRVSADTKVWKGEQQVKLADIAVGDQLLVNITAEQKDKPSICTDIWIGADTHAKMTEQQKKKKAPAGKKP